MTKTAAVTKTLTAGLLLGAVMLLTAGNASAEEFGAKMDAPRRAAAIIQKAGSLLSPLACNAHRALRLCADSQSTAFNFGMGKAKAATSKPAANKLFQIAQMFIDDMKVAEVGDWKIALKIEIE